MRILHLSDIHFGGYGKGWDENRDQRDELIRDVDRLVDAAGGVDAIVVGGDVAFSGQRAQYDDAQGWLSRLCETSHCPPSNVWVVPGNHDLDWAAIDNSPICKEFRSTIRASSANEMDGLLNLRLSVDPASEALMAPLAAYNEFAAAWNCAISSQNPSWHDDSLAVDELRIRLFGLNSILISDRTDKEEPSEQRLVVGTQQCRFGRTSGAINIALCHHPPTWLRDWDAIDPYLRRAHVVLFGHEHVYSAQQDVPRKTVFVFAGAVGPSELGQPVTDEFAPTYNMLTIEAADDGIQVKIEPRVWWRPSTRFDPFPDGDSEYSVQLDLEASLEAGDDTREESIEDAEPGISASPLVPEADSSPAEAEPGRRSRGDLREIGVRFMSKPVSWRIEAARILGVFEEDDLDSPSSEMFTAFLSRMRERNLIDGLVEELDRG